ncbi:MAG: alpha/beta hydrolase [Alphaproteobacteria bacterium]|nr:alpha/beta hydrolase [Alphaproteobacteria bacterium]
MNDGPNDLPARVEASASRHVMARPGGTVFWRLWGNGRRSLVLLHGASGSWTHWVKCIPGLAEHSRVIAPDMPGFGNSDLLPDAHTAEALAELVAEGIEEVVPTETPFDLAGFSFGGIIGTHVAARFGARVRNLILLGPGGLGLPPTPMPVLSSVQPGMSAEEERAVHRDNLRVLMIADPDKADDLAVTLQIKNLRRARFRSGRIPASDALVRMLPAVRARIVTIWGERDAFIGGNFEPRRRAFAPFQSQGDFHMIAGAGHWLPYEAPDEVNAILRGL